MAAPKGNQFWKIRSKHGREKLFSTPELLLESAEEYFEWCDEKTVQSDKGFSDEEKPTQRPYSKGGWFIYIGCSESWLTNYKKEASQDILKVIEDIENIIYTQQWDGATVGAYNANIIARSLGLSDNTNTKISGEIKVEKPMTIEEAKEFRKKIENL
jgi:hypothetical protein